MRAQTKLMSRTEQLRPAAHGTWAWAIGPRARELGGEPNPPLWSGAQRSASLDLLLGILGQCSIHGEGSARGHGYLCAERGGSAFGRREVSAGRLSSGGCPGCPGPRPASAYQLLGAALASQGGASLRSQWEGRAVIEPKGYHVMSGRRAEWVTSGARLLRGEGHEDVPLLVPEREEERLPAGGQPELDDTWLG